MKVRILKSAKEDLFEGYHFYERQRAGLGGYFYDTLFVDIAALVKYAGIHPKVFSWYRMLARRFPFAIYYEVDADEVKVRAVLDCRKNPSWIRSRLKEK